MIGRTSTGLGVALAFIAMLAGVPVSGSAQVSFGPLLTVGDDSEFGLGARTDFDLAGPMAIDEGYFRDLFGSVTATYSFMDCLRSLNCGMVELGGNAHVPLTRRGASLIAYAGAGVHIVGSFEQVGEPERDERGEHGRGNDSDDDPEHVMDRDGSRGHDRRSDLSVGPNILGGLKFRTLGVTGFLEGKLGFSGAGQFSLSTGFLFW